MAATTAEQPRSAARAETTPLISMRNIQKHFGSLHALRGEQKPADNKPPESGARVDSGASGGQADAQGSATSTEAVKLAQDAPNGAPDAKLSLAEAIGLLDPGVDAHWTSNNLPSLERLGELTGKKVARSDVDAVAEGYTRAKARAAKQ